MPRNNPAIGQKKAIVLPPEQWEFSKKLFGSYSMGVRELNRMSQVIAKSNIRDFCLSNAIADVSQEGIEEWLLANYPTLGDSQIKNHRDLALEIIQGECRFDGKRRISVIDLTVKCSKVPGKIIREVKQVFANGKERFRRYEDGSLYRPTEKIFVFENPDAAIFRLLEEELQIKHPRYVNLYQALYNRPLPVSSYQGIDSVSDVYMAEVEIEVCDYKPEYQEIQPNKTTIFQWID